MQLELDRSQFDSPNGILRGSDGILRGSYGIWDLTGIVRDRTGIVRDLGSYGDRTGSYGTLGCDSGRVRGAGGGAEEWDIRAAGPVPDQPPGAPRFDPSRSDSIRCHPVRSDSIRFDSIRFDLIRPDAIQCHAIGHAMATRYRYKCIPCDTIVPDAIGSSRTATRDNNP